jgi:hypothetical protein
MADKCRQCNKDITDSPVSFMCSGECMGLYIINLDTSIHTKCSNSSHYNNHRGFLIYILFNLFDVYAQMHKDISLSELPISLKSKLTMISLWLTQGLKRFVPVISEQLKDNSTNMDLEDLQRAYKLIHLIEKACKLNDFLPEILIPLQKEPCECFEKDGH